MALIMRRPVMNAPINAAIFVWLWLMAKKALPGHIHSIVDGDESRAWKMLVMGGAGESCSWSRFCVFVGGGGGGLTLIFDLRR